MVFLGFVVITYEDVGGDAAARDDALDIGDALQILLTGVFAVHQLQYLIASALCREVDVLAEIWLIGNGVENVLGHILWVRGGEAYTHVRYSLGYHVQEFGEGKTAFLTLARWRETIAVYVLSQKGNLLETTVVQVAHLSQDALGITAALTSTGIRNDAVVAEVVATTHDAYETAHSVATDALRHDVTVGLGLGKFDVDGVGSHLALRNHIRQVEIAVWSTDQVGIVVLDEVILHALSHAAQYAENHLSALLLLCMEGVEAMINLVFRILADTASVQEDGISLFFFLTNLVACHLHHRGNYLAVCHVHLAAISLNK